MVFVDIVHPTYRPSNITCQNMDCEKRHPKLCRVFARFRHCKFKECAYSHVQDGNTRKIDDLDKEVVELKEHVKRVSDLVDNLRDRERRRDMEVTYLKESLANMARKCEELKLEPDKISEE